MLTVKKTGDHYSIRNFTGQHEDITSYSFHKDTLPLKALEHMESLIVPGEVTANTYLLTSRQERELQTIFDKISNEKQSDYIFSDHLQRTYLVELVHFITKVHYKRQL